MPISNRSEFDAALKRQAELQRTAGTDPQKQRELRELADQIDAYRRANPDAGARRDQPAGTPANTQGGGEPGPDLSGQSVYDPHNQLNVGRGINDPNRGKDEPSSPPAAGGAAQPTPDAQPAPGAQSTPGVQSTPGGSTGNR